MLQELTITDFAIIRQIRLALSEGLVIFTGETGAGKSIVLDAIGALLGDRLSTEIIRTGAQRAIIEGVFTLPWLPTALARADAAARESERADGAMDDDEQQRAEARDEVAQLLHDHGLGSDDGTLIITREIATTGRSTTRINGRTMPLHLLARLGAFLVDVHGQGAHLELLRPEQHIAYLDRFGETMAQRQALTQAVRAWQTIRRAAEALRTDERELTRRAELLRYQVDEIDAARLHPGEVAILERERSVLANAERLRELSAVAHDACAGSEDGETPGALALLATAKHALRDLARLDAALETVQAALDDAIFRLEDVTAELRDSRDRPEADPERLAEIEDRLDRLTRLRRKYGVTIEEVLAFAENAREELATIEHREERLATLEEQIEHHRHRLGNMAGALSQRRQAAAAQMSQALEVALAKLNMRRARFVVSLTTQAQLDGVVIPERGPERVAITSTGIDRVEFLIAPNPGEPPRPLARIASGGETSRLMLALKSILAEADTTPTLIFDEVDAGISGLTGQIVGEMLWQLARSHQVICVTHLPQMAAFADQHWHVAKRVEAERTSTVVTELDAAGQTLEIAQMLGGIATETAARNAAELLDRAAEAKHRGAQSIPDVAANGHTTSARRGKRKAQP